jgi:methylamine dehydrogenase accessory protein MauD
MPIGWAIAVVVLWLAVCCLAVVVLGLLRQVASRPVQATPRTRVPRIQQWGPELGTSVPAFAARGIDGSAFTSADLAGEPGVLLFLSPGCDACDELTSQLREHDLTNLPSRVTVVTKRDTVGSLRLPDGLRVVTEADMEVSAAFNIQPIPFAIALDSDGVVCAKQGARQVSHLAGLAFAAVSAGSRVNGLLD